MPTLLVLDAGTGGAKCALFDVDGRLLALRRQAWDYHVYANPGVQFVREYSFDPGVFWSILCSCARRALTDAGVPPSDVIGVSATSQREGCVFLDADGAEIYAGPNLDARGFMEGLEVLGRVGVERLYEITGHSAPFIFPLARYLWFRKHDTRPVAHLLMINDWMTYRLCGSFCSEPSNGSESMLFDFRARRWSPEILDEFDIPAAVLAPVLECGQRAGSLGKAAAAAIGLEPGTPVFAGGADTQCALLGAGAVGAGDTAVILGTTTPIQTVTTAPMLDPASNLWAGCHVVPDRWVIEANVGSTGDAYCWLLDLLVHGAGDRYARAEEMARGEGEGTYSFIGPRIFDLTKLRPDMPGGFFFPFPTMQLRPQAGKFVRGFLESIAFAVRANLTSLAAVTGAAPNHLIATGGMSRNDLLVQLLADVTGLPIRRPREVESTGLGCAMLAATGAGAHPDPASAAAAMCRHERIEPDREGGSRYEAAFAKWRELYDTLDKLSI
jgi:sugar (pentulose or hexulose) kinase